ncbi:hypothetical protein Tco_0431299 [Tanacetum coccineum]
MSAFKVPGHSYKCHQVTVLIVDDEYVDMTRNKFLQYTRLDILEFRDTLIQNMDYVKKSIEKRALHKMEYDSRGQNHKNRYHSRSGNDAMFNDADIRQTPYIMKSNG